MKSPFTQLRNALSITFFGLVARRMKNSVICIMVLAAIAVVPAWAGSCHVVNSSCSSNGDGSSWSCAASGGGAGALNGLPASSSMVRGDSYYFAAGKYNVGSPTVFSTSDSGSSTITWKAVTASDNCTSTGFTQSLVGQAVFGPLEFTTNYWIIDGVYNSNGNISTEPFYPAGCPSANIVNHNASYKYYTCSGSGYGFKVENRTSGQDCSTETCTPVSNFFFAAALQLLGSNSTVEFVELEGSGDQTQTSCDGGFGVNQGNGTAGGSNDTIQYNWVHDVGTGSYFDGTQNAYVDHNWFQRSSGSGACHGETIGVRASSSGGTTNNFVFSNNFVENGQSTAMFNTPNSGANIFGGLYIFGNVFFCNTGEVSTAGNCHVGDGFIFDEFLGDGGVNPMVIVNNDFDGAPTSGTANMQIQLGEGQAGAWINSIVANNLWSNPPDTNRLLGFYCTPNGSVSNLTYRYNAYYGTNVTMGQFPNNAYSTQIADTTGSSQYAMLSTAGNPYVGAGTNAQGANNYALVAQISPMMPVGGITPPNGNINVDMLGNTRNLSRGALEFGGTTTGSAPNPPSGLTALVN